MTVGERSPEGRRDSDLRRRRLTLAPDAISTYGSAGDASMVDLDSQVHLYDAVSNEAAAQEANGDALAIENTSRRSVMAAAMDVSTTTQDVRASTDDPKVCTVFSGTEEVQITEAYQEAIMAGYSSSEAREIAGEQRLVIVGHGHFVIRGERHEFR